MTYTQWVYATIDFSSQLDACRDRRFDDPNHFSQDDLSNCKSTIQDKFFKQYGADNCITDACFQWENQGRRTNSFEWSVPISNVTTQLLPRQNDNALWQADINCQPGLACISWTQNGRATVITQYLRPLPRKIKRTISLQNSTRRKRCYQTRRRRCHRQPQHQMSAHSQQPLHHKQALHVQPLAHISAHHKFRIQISSRPNTVVRS